MIRGGATIVELRNKTRDKGELLPIALEMQCICKEKGVLFFINDDVDLVMAVHADGVHVGRTDLPAAVVRSLVPIDMLIGCSVYNVAQAVKAQAEGADYVAPGAIFATPSKESIVVGLEVIRKIKRAVTVPVIAIGGINMENVRAIKKAGADSFAVIRAVLDAPSPENAARNLVRGFNSKK